jgi:hypothetical protein
VTPHSRSSPRVVHGRDATVANTVPQQVLLQPAPLEYGLYRAQYDTLVKDLEGEGVLVRVSPAGEQRGIPPSLPANAADFYDLVIQVGEVAGTVVSTAKLVELVRLRLRGREGRGVEQRRANIYLANGDEHEFNFGNGQ